MRRRRGYPVRMRFAHAAFLAAAALPLAACWQTVEPFPAKPGASAVVANETPAFPGAWLGTWEGDLTAWGGQPMQVRMTLSVAPTATPGRWTWTITYDGTAGRQVRAYELVAADAAAGRWSIDERNGIVIPARWLDGVLYTDFQVEQARIATREQVVHAGTPDECLLVELATTKADAAARSGGGTVPTVTGWTPETVQRGILRRVK